MSGFGRGSAQRLGYKSVYCNRFHIGFFCKGVCNLFIGLYKVFNRFL